MSDTISRQAAIEVVDAVWSVTGDKNVAKVWDQIKDLPSTKPEHLVKESGNLVKGLVNDCISRKAALQAMDTWDKFGCDPDGKLVRYDDDKHYIPYVHYEDMVHAIKHLPSAQPEIIRCRDCIAYQEGIDIDGKPFTRCNGINGSVRTYGHTLPDWYCADAERRTDE